MNNLDLMRARLDYNGGEAQQDRMIKDKKWSMSKALLYSYQGAKVRKLGSETEERALINPNQVKQDYDDKIISIGFESEYTTGTIFEWVNTGTKWLIYLQDLTELAYFKGDIRKCNYEISWKNANGDIVSTPVALRGPKETSIDSSVLKDISVDSPNHTLNMLLPANEETLAYFKRYARFYLNGICWRVEGVDSISMQGIIEIDATEYYANKDTDDLDNGIANGQIITPEPVVSEIEGETFIKPKKTYTYKYLGSSKGEWGWDKKLPIAATPNGNELILKWTQSYTGQFDLSFGNTTKTIVVESLF